MEAFNYLPKMNYYYLPSETTKMVTSDPLKNNTLFIPHILYQEIHRLFLRIAPLDTYYKVHWTNE